MITQAEDLFKRITEAYEVLSDPTKRQFYDLNGFYSDGVLEEQHGESNWMFSFRGFDFSRSSEFSVRRYFRSPFRSQARMRGVIR